jgi:plasmid stabilization system protein ParE
MTRYVLADAARTDLLEIWDYLAEHADLIVADRIINDLHAAMSKLAVTPLIGHHCEDLTDQPVRFWSVHSYMVV